MASLERRIPAIEDAALAEAECQLAETLNRITDVELAMVVVGMEVEPDQRTADQAAAIERLTALILPSLETIERLSPSWAVAEQRTLAVARELAPLHRARVQSATKKGSGLWRV